MTKCLSLEQLARRILPPKPAGRLAVRKNRYYVPGIAKNKFETETLVPVQIAYSETKLKEMAKSMGGRWDPEVRLWYIHYGKIKGTELEKHIILDASMKSKTSESI